MMDLPLLVASGVAVAVTKIGTDGPDTLRGTNGADNLLGKGGNDILLALAGDDTLLLGGPGKDNLLGGNERRPKGVDKNLLGGSGNDWVNGGRGSDNVLGNDGNDVVVDGPDREFSTDNVLAGEGKDLVAARNKPAYEDRITCGGGYDRVLADRRDVVAANCEQVADTQSEVNALFGSIPESFWAGLPFP